MKKIVFVILPMKKEMKKHVVKVDGNALIETDKPIYYAVNPAVASKLEKDDELKVILLESKGGDNAGMDNAKRFIDELNEFNSVGAKIHKEIIPTAFDPSKTHFQEMFKALIKELEEGAEIYADVTFGPRTLAFLLFTVMQFGEKFFDCSIGNIVYSKVEFKDGKPDPDSAVIYDITPVYLLNSLIGVMEFPSGEKAIQAVNALFEK